MISVIHTSADELVDEVDDYPAPAGGCRMDLDWQCVAAAFDAAAEQFGWAAHVRVRPERRYVEVVVPADRTDHVARTTLDCYAAVAERIGIDEFLSIWVDFDVVD
ncbi:MAG TPA: hypothetical protein VGO40_08010 [Longimicrobium sp.]|jgi:hypothetical protein|nr:hypothetical protein [Longimicrobium sp.]